MASTTETRRKQVLVGELPEDFLRFQATEQQSQISLDEETARALQYQQSGWGQMYHPNIAGRLSITIAQAKLAKNYGLTKMDPYCRIRVGHSVFETPTAHNGAKNPRWNKVIQCNLPIGVDSFYLEIFDEKSFTTDDRIAWAHITIPQTVLNSETKDDWYSLSGRQGDEKEGMINLVLTFNSQPQPPPQGAVVYGQRPQSAPMYVVPQPMYYGGIPYAVAPAPGMQPVAAGMPVAPGVQPVAVAPGVQPPVRPPQPGQPAELPVQQQTPYPGQQQPTPAGPAITDEDIQYLQEMFPNLQKQVIASILEANRGDKEASINALLSMSTD